MSELEAAKPTRDFCELTQPGNLDYVFSKMKLLGNKWAAEAQDNRTSGEQKKALSAAEKKKTPCKLFLAGTWRLLHTRA